jgi:hypothetical protein
MKAGFSSRPIQVGTFPPLSDDRNIQVSEKFKKELGTMDCVQNIMFI